VEESVRKGIVNLLKSDPVVDLVLRVNCTAIEAEIGVDLSNYKNTLDIYVLFTYRLPLTNTPRLGFVGRESHQEISLLVSSTSD
jgi:hypothetical protein